MKQIKYNVQLLIKAFSYLGENRKKYILGVILGTSELALLFATPYITQSLINIFAGEEDGNIIALILLMLGIFSVLVPVVILGKYLQNIAAASGVADLRKAMYEHILSLPYSVITHYTAGDYIVRLTDDINKTAGVFSSFAINNLIRAIVVFGVTLVLLLTQNWMIAVVSVLYGLVNLLFSMYLNPKTKQLEKEAKIEITNSASFLLEALRGSSIVRVFNLQSKLEDKYLQVCEKIKRKRILFRTVNGITYGVVDFFSQSAQIVGFIIGILLTMNSFPIGDAVFCASLMGMMGDAFYRFSTFLLLFQPRLVAIERVKELMDITEIENNSMPLEQFIDFNTEASIQFKDVTFTYEDNRSVLKGIDLSIINGECIAIVGKSGGGKSTLVKLLEGFYRPTQGDIFYFEVNGKCLSMSDIRRMFAYVPQECILFDGTIKENIAFGKPGCSFEEVINAAKAAGIHEFICKMPLQYDTPVGERGGQLSGGEKQRIAIARAILRNAPILILDEATSALDVTTENDILESLMRVTKEKTTFIIAHRLSAIRRADRIFVVEDGKIVESGTFDELINRKGAFHALFTDQLDISL